MARKQMANSRLVWSSKSISNVYFFSLSSWNPLQIALVSLNVAQVLVVYRTATLWSSQCMFLVVSFDHHEPTIIASLSLIISRLRVRHNHPDSPDIFHYGLLQAILLPTQKWHSLNYWSTCWLFEFGQSLQLGKKPFIVTTWTCRK